MHKQEEYDEDYAHRTRQRRVATDRPHAASRSAAFLSHHHPRRAMRP